MERIGHPFDDLPLELCDGSPNKSGQQERQKPEPKPCPSCKFVKPAGTHECPKCGFKPERKSDVEVQDGELRRLGRKAKKPATPDRKQHVYSQLLQVARNKGYSTGWVSHKYRAMFDVWPRNMRDVWPRNMRDVTAAPTAELLSWLKSQQIAFAKAREKQQEGRNHV